MRGSPTAQSKTGQECRNVFSSLVWICHSLLFLQTRSEEKPLITSVVVKSAAIKWREDDEWRSSICKSVSNCQLDAHVLFAWFYNTITFQTDILSCEVFLLIMSLSNYLIWIKSVASILSGLTGKRCLFVASCHILDVCAVITSREPLHISASST